MSRPAGKLILETELIICKVCKMTRRPYSNIKNDFSKACLSRCGFNVKTTQCDEIEW